VSSLVGVLATVLLASPGAVPGPFGGGLHPVTSDVIAARAAGNAGGPAEAQRGIPLALVGYRLVSRFQGPRCPHRPSCSAYAAEAMSRHGWLMGSWIGAARLLRGEWSSALARLPRDGDGYLLDPLEASTFFLDGSR